MKSVILVVFLGILIVISSCQPSGTGTNIGGVDMQFLKDQPPLMNIRDNQEFNIGLVLTNSLPREVNDAKLCVYDTVTESAGGIPGKPCVTIFLPAAEQVDDKITPYKSDPIYFPENGGTYVYRAGQKGIDSTTILAELIYTADSTAKINNACFKRRSEIETDFPCETEEVFSGNSIDMDVAPIVINKIEKNIYPEGNSQNRMILTLYLSKGDGEVIWAEDETKNLVDIQISSSDAQFFTCSPNENGLIKFDEPTEKVTCESSFSLLSDYYQDSINIDLYYKFKIKLDTSSITIQKEGSSI